MRGYIAVALSTALLVVLPAAGMFGGGYAAIEWSKPEEQSCGMRWMGQILVIAVGALLGFGAGVGAGWFTALGIFRWANGCGLGDIRDESPFEL